MGMLFSLYIPLMTFCLSQAQLRFHSDNESLHFNNFPKDHFFYAILSWSFGATRTFSVKHTRTKVVQEVELASGVVVAMNGNFQQQYTHS